MSTQRVTLNDRFDLTKSPVLLNGTQALVRLMLMQKARDRAAGLNTAGYVTGYRGSPLGAVDMQMTRAKRIAGAADVTFPARAERGSRRHRALGQPAGGTARRGQA
jgi:indolepyruvate ferredoxin oxidoreductase